MDEEIACTGFFMARTEDTVSCLESFEQSNWIAYILGNILEAFWNVGYALTHPALWLDWSNSESLMRFIYYGASVELFFVVLVAFLVLTICGMIWTGFLWRVVGGLEAVSNTVGRVVAWAGLIMVLQQIVVVFMQRIFAVSQLSFGFGKVVTFDLSWWSEELKLYNAAVVSLCLAYTFVQGGHVRVDLVYSAVSHRTKRVIDMFGSIFFMMPAALLIWIYAWFFQWRHLVVPNVSASDPLDRVLMKARALRWNVETIGFSPNGFNAYFLFKTLLLLLTAMIFLQAATFFWRSYLEWREGEESAGKNLDLDDLGDDPDPDPHHHADAAHLH